MRHISQTLRLSLAFALGAVQALGQTSLPSTWPHNYHGIPNTKGNFKDSVAWQKYFEVKDPLPNITFPLTRSFAGNIPVNRKGHENNTLFFWAFEKKYGSLTDQSNRDDPWVIWLNGGPGSSSMLGLLLENGPIHFNEDFSAFSNNFSWNTAADMFWIDQPVGTGWSTSDVDGYVGNEDEVAQDFFGFLSNLVQVFPGLAKRPLHLTGESYAGVYIPYITKAYFSLSDPPVYLRKFAIGDGLYNTEPIFSTAVVSVIETYPQLIGYDIEVFNYFKDQLHLCGLDINFTYPQNGIIPALSDVDAADTTSASRERSKFDRLGRSTLGSSMKRALTPRHDEEAWRAWKRDLSGRANGTIDPWYGCDLFDEMVDYALNFSAPWNKAPVHDFTAFDAYYIPDALFPEAAPTTDSVGVFLNDPRVVAAIHAPTSKNWTSSFLLDVGYPFMGGFGLVPSEMFQDLANNMSAHGINWTLYSGNADSLLAHFGTEITIQNTTFGGIQGFSQPPSTPFYDYDGNFAGKIHQERGVQYALFAGAGHLIPQTKPNAALFFLKEFLLGTNPLGTVLANGTVVGGVNATLASDVLPAGHDPIFTGSGTTQGSYFYPSATVAAWDHFTATADATPTAV